MSFHSSSTGSILKCLLQFDQFLVYSAITLCEKSETLHLVELAGWPADKIQVKSKLDIHQNIQGTTLFQYF